MTMIQAHNNGSIQCSDDLRELEPANLMRSYFGVCKTPLGSAKVKTGAGKGLKKKNHDNL